MRPFDPVLYPFALLYDGMTRLRNKLFDIGSKRSVVFEIPTVVVGNLALGGTGKTPMVEFIIERLSSHYEIATLSRGYGRKTTGVIIADQDATAEKIGDEPFQIFTKFGEKVHVAVGEQRVMAIPQVIMEFPGTDLILLDDAFQHRYVKGDFSILLTTFQKPFFDDKVVPLGTLREHRKGASRAQAVVVTKCPNELSEKTKQEYRSKIAKYAVTDTPVFFAGLKYGDPYEIFPTGRKLTKDVILLTGIADNKVLKERLEGQYNLKYTLEFADHHKYTEEDAGKIRKAFQEFGGNEAVILTTEKDMVKLKDRKFAHLLEEIPIFAIPVKVDFDHKDEKLLMDMIQKSIIEKDYKREV
ncbi:tetraacyldisaccharide 4'-kinase [Litoribacter alkaliphilus]|uniref:Tetraacyldisaccharide 4'-kinase n=1 Tax=Litoribacter ruber TaxID=702568 RepID=A0AAP2CJ84_9BACT|nr:tetraacyldisaccharide 4'-kinase [Litoribacter alkaliphilus]MBS9524714.1 tetraacyldisaccharide 4'-kinase [Litoribacter alkaliphilus]